MLYLRVIEDESWPRLEQKIVLLDSEGIGIDSPYEYLDVRYLEDGEIIYTLLYTDSGIGLPSHAESVAVTLTGLDTNGTVGASATIVMPILDRLEDGASCDSQLPISPCNIGSACDGDVGVCFSRDIPFNVQSVSLINAIGGRFLEVHVDESHEVMPVIALRIGDTHQTSIRYVLSGWVDTDWGTQAGRLHLDEASSMSALEVTVFGQSGSVQTSLVGE